MCINEYGYLTKMNRCAPGIFQGMLPKSQGPIYHPKIRLHTAKLVPSMYMFEHFLGASRISRKNVCVVDRVMKVPET